MAGEAAEVVLGGHDLAVGTGAAHGEQVASLDMRDGVVLDEDIAGLAHGSDDIVELLVGIGTGEVLDTVESAIEGGSDKVIHPRIDDSELLIIASFDIEDAGHEVTALGDDGAS